MKERPVLFSAPMIHAILDGRKTQTRRIIKPEPAAGMHWNAVVVAGHGGWCDGHGSPRRCPYGEPGDSLWVRETHCVQSAGYRDGTGRLILYRATEPDAPCTWTPSIFMPRWASRITLRVTSVRAERLHEISEADARAEGASFHDGHGVGHSGWRHDFKDVHADARSSFARLWTDINGRESWDANPWVWVIGFERSPLIGSESP